MRFLRRGQRSIQGLIWDFLGSTNPADCVLVLQIMYCRCHVVCLSRSASRSKDRVICAFFETRTQWPVVVFLKSFCYYLPRGGSRGGAQRARLPLMFRPNWGPKGRKKLFETAPSPPPPSLSKGLDPPLLTYLWQSFILTGQLAVGKNQRRGLNRERKLMVSMSENLFYFTKSNLDFQRIVIV